MTTQTKVFYPRTVTQTTGGKYAKFNDLNVIKAVNNGYAQTDLINSKKKSPNRPSTVTCTDFNMKIPVGAVVTKIVVEYKHLKVASSGKYNNIPAPTVSLLHDGSVIKVTEKGGNYSGSLSLSKKSAAPKATPDTRSPTWNGKNTFTVQTINSSNVVEINTGKTTVTKTKKIDTTYSMPTRTVFTSPTFGVRIDYPTNTNENPGYLRLYWVRVKVTYVESTYTMSTSRVYGGTNHDGSLNPTGGYNHMEYRLKAKINRKSKTSYIPKVTITTPVGFTFKEGSNNVVQKNARTLVWTPELPPTRTTASDNVELAFDVDVTYASGQTSYNATFDFVESLNNTTVYHNTTIIDRPDAPGSETGEQQSENINLDENTDNVKVRAVKDEEFELNIEVSESVRSEMEEIPEEYILASSYNFVVSDGFSSHLYQKFDADWYTISQVDYALNSVPPNDIHEVFKCDLVGNFTLTINYYISWSNTDTGEGGVVTGSFGIAEINIRPTEESLTIPNMSILVPTTEEQDRLGDHHKYTVQSNIKLTTSLAYVPDWYKNFRIGVFNNPIEDNITRTTYIDEDGNEQEAIIDTTDYNNLTVSQIFDNAEYWSNAPSTPNAYDNLECQFMHDKDYPLYILLVGDYPEGDQSNNTIRFTEPCIVETDTYKGRDTNGIFPVPIDNLVSNDNDTSELTLEPLGASNNFILCEFPLDPDTGTDDLTAIQGIEVTGNIEAASDDLILYAKLKAPDGNTGQRSIILKDVDTTPDGDTTFSIGGPGDLWGFNILDMTNLEDWEIELGISNALQETESTLNFGDIQVNIYTETINPQNIHCFVNDENLAFYGLFLTDLNIPPGLNTDVSFLKIDGTDTNDAYRQNIKEKTITLEFEIGENCNLELNTQRLRQLTRLLTNEKDQYNRPIPKRVTFSHLPDVYYEYIIEDSPEISVEVSTYKVKAKLIIPSGTAYSKNSTTTNTVGYVQGLAKVKPIITARPTDELIEIRETRSGQKFNMGYTGQWTDKIIEIDCEDRIVWLKTDEDDTDPVNITKYCDYNSDWFSLHGEYVFESTNCVIRTIDYIERW